MQNTLHKAQDMYYMCTFSSQFPCMALGLVIHERCDFLVLGQNVIKMKRSTHKIRSQTQAINQFLSPHSQWPGKKKTPHQLSQEEEEEETKKIEEMLWFIIICAILIDPSHLECIQRPNVCDVSSLCLMGWGLLPGVFRAAAWEAL